MEEPGSVQIITDPGPGGPKTSDPEHWFLNSSNSLEFCSKQKSRRIQFWFYGLLVSTYEISRISREQNTPGAVL